MTHDPNHLIEMYAERIPNLARGIARSKSQHVIDDNLSAAYEALVQCAHRWESYCESNGYDPERVDYFWTYAYRRIQGSIKDGYRDSDWMSRTQRGKFKRDGTLPAAHKSKITSVDLSDPNVQLRENVPSPDTTALVNEAQRAAHRVYMTLPVGQQLALAIRVTQGGMKGWGQLWELRRSTGASLISQQAAREIYKVVAALAGQEPKLEPFDKMYEPVIEKSVKWKPNDEILDFLGCPVDEYIENFGNDILTDDGVLTQIIWLVHPTRTKRKNASP